MKVKVRRRGLFLVIIGIIQLIIGWATLISPPINLAFLHMASFVGPVILGIIMLASGIVVCVNALWPPGRDRLGFMLAFPVPLFWGLDILITTLLGEYPIGGMAGGLRGVAFWWGYAALILLVSGMVGVEEYGDGDGGK